MIRGNSQFPFYSHTTNKRRNICVIPVVAKKGDPMKQFNTTSINPYIGQRIRMERRQLGISQETLASDLNISANYISEIERGKKVVSLNMAEKLCAYFHITLDYLYRGITPDILCEQVCYDPDPYRELLQLLELCNEQETRLCLDIIRPVLIAWRSSLDAVRAERNPVQMDVSTSSDQHRQTQSKYDAGPEQTPAGSGPK